VIQSSRTINKESYQQSMANNWTALQAQFELDHERYGTSAKDWCEAKGLNYASARRYIKVRKIAQSVSAQSKSAQSAQNKTGAKKKKVSTKNKKSDSSNNSNSPSDDLNKYNTDSQRDEKGWFKSGNQIAVGNTGNPEPSCSFEHGHQLSRRSGVYARLLTDDMKAKHEFSKFATLEDELDFTRTRYQAGIEYLQRIAEDMKNSTTIDERLALYDNYQKTENRMDVLTGRIESITKTLSSIGIDVVNKEKIIHDTTRIKNASRKLALEADKLQSDGQGDDTPMASIVEEIQSMSKSGLMSE
jgi:hypothetical protein